VTSITFFKIIITIIEQEFDCAVGDVEQKKKTKKIARKGEILKNKQINNKDKQKNKQTNTNEQQQTSQPCGEIS